MYFNPPPVTIARHFAHLPEQLRRRGRDTAWHTGQPGIHPEHSLLEGPAFDRDGKLWCVDVPYGRIFHVSPTGKFIQITEYDGEPNGLAIHRDGRIFIADYAHGIMVLDPATEEVRPYLTRVRLERFKAVNDLVFSSNGDLYFTDQGLTGLQDPSGRVFRLREDGKIDCLLDNVPSPNGIALSADERTLYVAVTRANAVWRIPLMPDGMTAKVGNFIQLSGGGGPDGLAVDSQGNLAVAHIGLGVVWLFSPQGRPLACIQSPEGAHTTNIAFDASGERLIYITESETGTILSAPVPEPGLTLYSHT